LPGPDLTATELAQLLTAFGERRVAVVNAASASGGFVQKLAAPTRIVVTATKSGFERNETVFGRHFVAAWTGGEADADKDERVSLLEAFEYTRREVEREYQRENKLMTEHAMLDALGDGKGVASAELSSPHGRAAHAFHLGGGAAAAAASARTPELRAAYQEKARIEAVDGFLGNDAYGRLGYCVESTRTDRHSFNSVGIDGPRLGFAACLSHRL
jgi:hypothetical protein